MRVLVCDDEPLAVQRLLSLLARVHDVEVVATAEDGIEVPALVIATRPDLLLLDIEMPEVDGLDVVEVLATRCRKAQETPLVAFITAHRRFAPQAFERGAIDFLPKPTPMARLNVTLDRARQALAGREAERRLVELQGMLDELRENRQKSSEPHIWVSRRGEVIRVDLDRIDRIEADGTYVHLHVGGNAYLHREAISIIETRLDATRFLRVHRSHIVRRNHVSSIRRTVHGGAELLLTTGEVIPLGRKYAVGARRRLRTREEE